MSEEMERCPACNLTSIRCYDIVGGVRKMVCENPPCKHCFDLETPAPAQSVVLPDSIMSHSRVGRAG